MIAPAGRKLGKYEILRKLGRGGMADVYLAQDTVWGNPVALKLIEHSADRDTHDAIEAERRGAGLQAHLAAIDSHVAAVFGSGDIDGFFFVAMEYVDGRDLAELMGKGPLAPEFAADVAIAVAETLENAHNLRANVDGRLIQGIVHGDIKPKNIRIDTVGEVRVLDFGIAKALSLSRRLTRNEFGSVPYASPERLESGDVSAHSDLWSLAVMLYEMVTGMQPYQAANTERLERMIRSHIPPPPPPDPCPEHLRRILNKAMAPDPAQRYQTAREFADELIAFRGGEMLRAAMDTPGETRPLDQDATRRTWRTAKADYGETRRTGQTGGQFESTRVDQDATRRSSTAPFSAPNPVPGDKPKPTVFRRGMRLIAALAIACLVCGAWSAVSDYLLYQRGRQLEREIQTEQLTDPDQIWTKWTELSKDNSTSWLLGWPRQAVMRSLMEAADRVIATYRKTDAPPPSQKDWEHADTLLTHALTLEPRDNVRGELRLVEGHLERFAAAAHHDAQEYRNAIEKFEEAQRLLPKSPDPELGMARVYVYGLKDIDKANEALQEAARRGYQLGNREKAQLADGYRERANRLYWDSRNVRGMPQEKDQIQRAAGDYEHALQLYQSIAPYGTANERIADVQTSLDSVNTRLQQIEHPESARPEQEPKKEFFKRLEDLIKNKIEHGHNLEQN